MPPKRKATGGSNKASKKQKKVPTLKEVRRPYADAQDAVSGRHEVRWGLPATARDNNVPDTSDDITHFAPALYGQNWNELTTREAPFGFPRLRTPLYKVFTDKAYVPPGNNVSQTSEAVLRFFDVIKRDSQPQKKGAPPRTPGPYVRNAFENAFGDEEDDLAVIASRSADHPVLALDQDYRLEVTIQNVDSSESAHVNFLRRASPPLALEPVDLTTNYAYFIELPPGTNVTVNGHTYINDPNAGVSQAASSPFIIGPFAGYTVIELLSQPIFFFRRTEDLNFTAPVVGARARPSAEEMENRDKNGDVALEDTTVTWSPIGTAAPAPQTSPKGSKTGEKSVQDSGSRPQPSKAPVIGPAGAQSPERTVAYDDTWTDQGEPILDVCEYVRRHLVEPHQRRYNELVPRVLAAINDRQAPGAGFSLHHGDRILRPGRTLIAPLNNNNHHVLLVAQILPDGQITLRIMDPIAWRSTRADRDQFNQQARQLLASREWWRDSYDSSENMERHLPEAIEWVPCAQHTVREQSVTYTVLNAWAIAFGLVPNSAFRLSRNKSATFFTRAQRLFDSALEDGLSWKMLLAFLRCTRFVKRKGEGDTSGDESLPPQDRRFDQRVRGFRSSLERRENQDNTPDDASGEEDSGFVIIAVGIVLEEGITHTETFASDDWEEEKLEDLAALVRHGSWTLTFTQEELRGRVNQRQNDKSASPKPSTHSTPRQDENSNAAKDETSGPPPGKSAPSAPQPPLDGEEADTTELPEDFDPCAYFQEKINTLPKRGMDSLEQNAPLGVLLFSGIGPVLRAVNQFQPQGEGFELSTPGSMMGAQIDDKGRIKERVMLLSLIQSGHAILVVIRLEHTKDGDRILADAVDSAPWTFTQEQREEVYALILSNWRAGIEFAERINWHSGPQQFEAWQAAHFSVLNAWCILLGLPVNNDFQPKDTFIHQVNQLIGVIKHGSADWMLIWTFLRCIGYVSSGELPAKDRRFSKTLPDSKGKDYMDSVSKRSAKSLDLESRTNFIGRLFHSAGVPQGDDFQWDDLEPEDRSIRIPTLKRTGRFNNSLNRSQIRNLYHNLPRDFDPCAYFRQRMDALLQTRAADLRDFRDREKNTVTERYSVWLEDGGITLAIASVTLAITQLQDSQISGFGFVHPVDVQQCAQDGPDILPIPRTIRPGRPLLVPININQHFILLVIQLNEKAEPTFSVLDSKAYHLQLRDREFIHNQAWRIVRKCGWGQHVFDVKDLKRHRPAYTSWIPVSQQPSDDECGYYTIFNAWTLALGLLPNPDPNLCLDWTDQFFYDVKNLLHLARMGHVDWSLIYAFLRCRGLVQEGHVPLDRQFAATAELRNDGDSYLNDPMNDLRQVEEIEFMSQPTLDRQQLKNANRSALPEGRRHNDLVQFISDRWDENDRTIASALAQYGRLKLDYSRANLKAAYQNLPVVRGLRLKNELLARGANFQKLNRDELLRACKRYMTVWHTGRDLLLQEKPRKFFEDTKPFLDYLFFSPNFVSEKLKGGLFERQTQLTAKWNFDPNELALFDSDINLAIVAVVEAIDDLQSRNHKQSNDGAIFAGGFSFAPSFQLQMALTSGGGGRVTRPRRCWLMPVAVLEGALLTTLDAWRKEEKLPDRTEEGQADGHHLLAVVQEDRTEEPSFKVTFYDSAVRVFGDSYDFLATAVEDAARDLQWSTHRNTPARLEISKLAVNAVPQQGRGGWQCGPHVVINAWILAMGLHPDRAAKFSNQIYAEFFTLARAACAGLLDWRTLAAWFFCRHLTYEKRLEAIPENRRFAFTRFCQEENALHDRMDVISVEDAGLAEVSELAVDYDLSNNPVHRDIGQPPLQAKAESSEVEDEDDEEEEEEEYDEEGEDEEGGENGEPSNQGTPDNDAKSEYAPSSALARRNSSLSIPFLSSRPLRTSRPRKGRAADALHFLDDFDIDVTMHGTASVDEAGAGAEESLEHEPDRLFFLDAY
ncbi:Nn.00g113010.m01.CDS01 [Neocucurbitaria sp. VM-36]